MPPPVEVPATAHPGTITIHVGRMSVEVEGNVNKTSLKTVLNVLQEI